MITNFLQNETKASEVLTKEAVATLARSVFQEYTVGVKKHRFDEEDVILECFVNYVLPSKLKGGVRSMTKVIEVTLTEDDWRPSLLEDLAIKMGMWARAIKVKLLVAAMEDADFRNYLHNTGNLASASPIIR